MEIESNDNGVGAISLTVSVVLFWDVDTQIDFLLPSGRLYVSRVDKIIPNLYELTGWAGIHGALVVSSACAHLFSDPELQTLWTALHGGTFGQQKVPETLLSNRFVVPNRRVELQT